MSRDTPLSCDIFCAVVDNFGDIGVCWRLARQLSAEHGVQVRMWVDDLVSFKKLCPELKVDALVQLQKGVQIHHWLAELPVPEPANLVIEAFACKLPEAFVAAMAAMEKSPVWLNLEYLSAEEWVNDSHGLPSPHPQLPLVKYFFFPGFTPRTGGLLLERDLLTKRDAFQADSQAQLQFWQSLGLKQRQAGELRISLFGYENAALEGLLQAWQGGLRLVTCLVPEGRVLAQLGTMPEWAGLQVGGQRQLGNLRVCALPFVEQDAYDRLLWACDVNFVRGEDSCVRAQWAGRPFVWHIYPQLDGVHHEKLRALLGRYVAGLPAEGAGAVSAMWEMWNASESVAQEQAAHIWNQFVQGQSMLTQHAQGWAAALSSNNLALNLLDFFGKVGKMRPFENQAGRIS